MSAKDINLWKVQDYGISSKPSKISTKEWQQMKMLQANTNLTNAKTFKYNTEERKAAEKFNADQAKLTRDWQEYMSNTSHEREVKDLKKAGLNPVLSANTGAQSYTTNAASIAGASGKADSAASAIASYGGAYLGSQATKYSANQSAAATRYASNMSYASAQATAAAMMYSADQSVKAAEISGKYHFEATKYSTDYSKEVTFPGIFREMIVGYAQGDENSVGYRVLNPIFSWLAQKYPNSSLWSFLGHPGSNKCTASNLSKQGLANVMAVLNRNGYEESMANANALILAATTSDPDELNKAAHILDNNRKKKH